MKKYNEMNAPENAPSHAPDHAPGHAPDYAPDYTYAPENAPDYVPDYAPENAPENPPAEPPIETEVAERLDKALNPTAPVSRSSDLASLTLDYDNMRRELKVLISSAQKYRDSMTQLDEARMHVRAWLSMFETIFESVKRTHPI